MPINPVTRGYASHAELPSSEAVRTRQAFEQMEQLFLHTLLREMRKTVPEGGLFKKENSTRIFEDMLDEVFSLKMAESRQLGMASVMQAQYEARGLLPGAEAAPSASIFGPRGSA